MLRLYQVNREKEGAAPATINRELSTLSELFGALTELQLVGSNPARLVKRLSTKSGERQAYLAFEDVHRIAERCPVWFRPLVWTAYYTGMRRGEILGLTRNQVDLTARMITLTPDGTKEGAWKRVPIHRDLVPILRDATRLSILGSPDFFVMQVGEALQPLNLEAVKNPWRRACKALDLPKPWPRFHDLRHTWKTNARRSRMDPEIREAILGHSSKRRSVSERYGYLSDQELLDAIDTMTFDHGATKILVAEKWKQNGNKIRFQEKRSRCHVT